VIDRVDRTIILAADVARAKRDYGSVGEDDRLDTVSA
jgi:hypothetical protein